MVWSCLQLIYCTNLRSSVHVRTQSLLNTQTELTVLNHHYHYSLCFFSLYFNRVSLTWGWKHHYQVSWHSQCFTSCLEAWKATKATETWSWWLLQISSCWAIKPLTSGTGWIMNWMKTVWSKQQTELNTEEESMLMLKLVFCCIPVLSTTPFLLLLKPTGNPNCSQTTDLKRS